MMRKQPACPWKWTGGKEILSDSTSQNEGEAGPSDLAPPLSSTKIANISIHQHKAGQWYYEAVYFCADRGLVGGYPDGTFQIGPSKKIASLSLKCRLKDGARAKHIYDLLFEKMSAASESVSKDMVRNNEARNGGWDSYAMNTINGFTWRLGLSGHHELDLYENNDGGYTIDIEAYAMSWPGMNG